MKKLFALLISVMLCFCFVACTTTPANKSEVSSVITESETSSFASSDSDETSSEPTSSKSNSTSTSSKNNSTSSKVSVSSGDTNSNKTPSRPAASGTSSIKIPIEHWPGFKNNSGVKEEDKVTPIVSSGVSVSSNSGSSEPVSRVTPLLYKVTGENGTNVYLFGSIHVGKKDMYPLPDYVLDAYNSADSLAVECDPDNIDDKTAEELAEMMIITNGYTLRYYIGSTLYDEVKSIVAKEKIMGWQWYYDYYKPTLWISEIEGYLYKKANLDSKYGIDSNLISKARSEKKEVIEIESVIEQYKMLNSFSSGLKNQLLYSAVYNYHYHTVPVREITDLYDSWCSGNYEKLREHCTADTQGSTEEETKLLTEYNTKMSVNRDKKMTDFVVESLKGDKDIFVCVGAAHIVGENAVVDQLKDLGYTVTQVTKES
ncbi:MAG: TraB/GumN family protein [Oscillospiraceae bacterium]|nr:TraB/GumN family protein [Oscillospiraceae bacterium]